MSEQNQEVVQDGQVVTLAYTLTVDGEIIDSAESSQPIQFIQGHRQVIPGLEDQLYGMAIGEKKDVVVQPEDGYGPIDPENFIELPREQFPAQIPLDPGVELELTDQDGEMLEARIVSLEGETVRLDLNPPLAGKVLHFSVAVVDLREASEEELEHGHVHAEGWDGEGEPES